MDEMYAKFREAFPLEPLYHVNHRSRLFPVKRLQGVQAFTVFRQSHRHHGHALQIGDVLHQLPDAVLQLLPVIESLAEHDLPVHTDVGLHEPVHLLQGLPGEAVVQHPAAQLWIHGLEGDIDGGETVSADPVDVMVRHIGQGHIVPLQEGEPGIVVLEIQGVPHAGGHLVDEAEYALIVAVPVLVHQAALELQPQILVIVLVHLQEPLLPVRLLQEQLDIGVLYHELVVENILHFHAVDGDQPVAGCDFQFLPNASGHHPLYDMGLVLHVPYLSSPGTAAFSFFAKKDGRCSFYPLYYKKSLDVSLA